MEGSPYLPEPLQDRGWSEPETWQPRWRNTRIGRTRVRDPVRFLQLGLMSSLILCGGDKEGRRGGDVSGAIPVTATRCGGVNISSPFTPMFLVGDACIMRCLLLWRLGQTRCLLHWRLGQTRCLITEDLDKLDAFFTEDLDKLNISFTEDYTGGPPPGWSQVRWWRREEWVELWGTGDELDPWSSGGSNYTGSKSLHL